MWANNSQPNISSNHMNTNNTHQNLSAVAETQRKKYPWVIKHESAGAGSLAWSWAHHSYFENKALKYQSPKEEGGIYVRWEEVNEYGAYIKRTRKV